MTEPSFYLANVLTPDGRVVTKIFKTPDEAAAAQIEFAGACDVFSKEAESFYDPHMGWMT